MRTLLALGLLAACHVSRAEVPVTVPMLDRLADPSTSLRGSVDRRVVVRYVPLDDAPNERRLVVSPDIRGKIVGMDRDAAVPRVFVSFDPACAQPDCAFTFVPDPDGALHLSAAPDEPGYQAPLLYVRSVRDRNRLRRSAEQGMALTSDGAPVRFETTTPAGAVVATEHTRSSWSARSDAGARPAGRDHGSSPRSRGTRDAAAAR